MDGALLHALRMPFGYWEAKDEKDDLDAEISFKLRRGLEISTGQPHRSGFELLGRSPVAHGVSKRKGKRAGPIGTRSARLQQCAHQSLG